MTPSERVKAWRLANPEKFKAQQVAYKISHREVLAARNKKYRLANLGKIRQQKAAYYIANKDIIISRLRKYAEENSEAAVKRVAQWAINNPERARERRIQTKHNRRARERGASTSRVDYKLVLERHGMMCGICALPIEGKYHYDHIIPLSKGGAHAANNLQLSHPICNLRKGAKVAVDLLNVKENSYA